MPATHPVTVIQGVPRHPQPAARLRANLEDSELDGTLIIGYPVRVDAVLISGQGHVTVFHLDPEGTEDPVDGQDQAWTRIDRLLRLKAELRRGRHPLVVPQSLTINYSLGARPDLTDAEHPVATPETVLDVLRAFHRRTPPDPSPAHDAIVDQILWIPPVD